MNLRFIGTGEAVDPTRNNTSLLVDDFLFDCGYNVTPALVRQDLHRPLNRVWISHFHGDHFAGTATLILALSDAGRTEPLEFIGPEGIKKTISKNLMLHYRKDIDGFDFPVEFTAVDASATLKRASWKLRFHKTRHKRPCLAIKAIHTGEHKSFVYTADTEPFAGLLDFAQDADLLVHECFSANTERGGHTDAATLAKLLANRKSPPRLALVHCSRDERREEIVHHLKQGYGGDLMTPDDGRSITL